MLNDLIDWLITSVQAIDQGWLIAIAGLAILLETSLFVGLLVPGDSVLLLAATGVTGWGSWGALVAAAICGALLGESIGFALGRWIGGPLRNSRAGRLIGERNWELAERYLRRRGTLAVFVSRFLPVLHSVVPAAAGMAGMPYRRFMMATIPACVLWALVYVSVGSLAAASYEAIGSQLKWAGVVFAGVILLFVLVSWLVRRKLQRTVESET